MHPQLQLVVAEFAAAQERLHRLAAAVPDEWWGGATSPRSLVHRRVRGAPRSHGRGVPAADTTRNRRGESSRSCPRGTILPRHQHRHIWQAEQVLEGLRRAR